MKKTLKGKLKSISKPLCYLLGLFLFVIIWEIIAFATDQIFIPEFFSCIGDMFLLLGKSSTFLAIGHTILNLIISLLGSLVLGIVFGNLAGYFPKLAQTLSPIITILRAFPTIALVFLLVVFVPNFSWYVVGLVIFPIIYQATYDGALNIYKNFRNQLVVDGKRPFEAITKVIVPLNINNMLLGLVQAFGLGLKVEIMAETFAYSVSEIGLGNYIQLAYQNVDYKTMMSYVLLCIIISLLVDALNMVLRKKLLK